MQGRTNKTLIKPLGGSCEILLGNKSNFFCNGEIDHLVNKRNQQKLAVIRLPKATQKVLRLRSPVCRFILISYKYNSESDSESNSDLSEQEGVFEHIYITCMKLKWNMDHNELI